MDKFIKSKNKIEDSLQFIKNINPNIQMKLYEVQSIIFHYKKNTILSKKILLNIFINK